MAGVTIDIRDNGPYFVRGGVTVKDALGNVHERDEELAVLCRCGHSERKPFCDGTHRRTGFQSAPRAG
jgi:CDGSH-type Zn-finger protein